MLMENFDQTTKIRRKGGKSEFLQNHLFKNLDLPPFSKFIKIPGWNDI